MRKMCTNKYRPAQASEFVAVVKEVRIRKIMIKNFKKGFTLIELLVVIGIIGILAAVVLVAVNPGRQFAQARDTQRRSDLLTITNSIYQFAAEHDGNLPDTDGDDTTSNFPAVATCIGDGTTACAANAGCSGMTSFALEDATDEAGLEVIVPTYVAALPVDPSTGDATDSGYCISVSADGRVTATAEGELTATISVER